MSLGVRAGLRGVGAEAVVWVLRGPVTRADIADLCAYLASLDAALVHCDVAAVEPDLVLVEALARRQLTARRLGRRVRVVGAGPHLRDLLHATGLAGVLSVRPDLRRPDTPAGG
jgi:hypothetical protein